MDEKVIYFRAVCRKYYPDNNNVTTTVSFRAAGTETEYGIRQLAYEAAKEEVFPKGGELAIDVISFWSIKNHS